MPFGDIPLFRELQKLLSSGGGPVNFEIARQVSSAMSSQGPPFTAAPQDAASLAEGVQRSEFLIAGYTRLSFDEPIRTTTLTRSEWAAKTLDAWGWLLEHLATRFTQELGRLGGEDEAQGMQAAMAQVGPLLMGMQAGTLVGQLSLEAVARYDLPIPRDDEGMLFAVTPNVETLCNDYGFDRRDFYRWVAVREIARHICVVATPWLDRYHRSLLTEIVDSTEIDVGDLERRMIELQTRGMEALQEGAGEQGMLPLVSNERHRKALDRLHALIAVREGYADLAADAVGPSVVEDKTKIDEGMRRWRSSPSQGQSLLMSVLGVSVDRSLEQSGRTFCNAIVELRGLPTLNRIWEAPDYLPSTEEIKDPFLWLERIEAE
jgi:putative hydrolase